jgi:hypothetical protein
MNIYDKILISLPEYNFFRELRDVEKIQYLLEVYDIETKRNGNIINGLNNFFDDISDEDFQHGIEFDSIEYGNKKDRVDIMIDNENIIIESNSLKALRFIAYKFMDGGYIISRDKNTEKLFVKDKITRYLRVFKILGQSNCLCYN